MEQITSRRILNLSLLFSFLAYITVVLMFILADGFDNGKAMILFGLPLLVMFFVPFFIVLHIFSYIFSLFHRNNNSNVNNQEITNEQQGESKKSTKEWFYNLANLTPRQILNLTPQYSLIVSATLALWYFSTLSTEEFGWSAIIFLPTFFGLYLFVSVAISIILIAISFILRSFPRK